MTFQNYLSSKRTEAERSLPEFFQIYRAMFRNEPQSEQVISMLETVIPKGKLMRFALTQLGFEGYSDVSNKNVILLGIILECIHTGLLFQDDIMDEDTLRRGNDSLHITYAKKYQKSARNPQHLGESLTTCTADFAFFIAFDLISHLDISLLMKEKVTCLLSREFARVSLAQMEDSLYGQTPVEPTQENIIQMYRGKTGRYSVALPLICGATVAGAHSTETDLLWKIGESLGILYQIHDDTLSIFGNEKVTGKPLGSDIIQNKKTLIRQYLFAHSDKKMLIKLHSLFGNASITSDDIAYIQTSLSETGTIQWIHKYISEEANDVRLHIQELEMKQSTKDILHNFLQFISDRNS